jgi:pimeloyl-ACP methyl ester carboxylesterase
MKQILLGFLLVFIFLGCNHSADQNIINPKEETKIAVSHIYDILFPSLDGLDISAKVYEISDIAPVILLCHQAGFNKFEHEGIAQKLNEQGFNCVAIDQRSGGPIANRVNETTVRALKAGKSIDYLEFVYKVRLLRYCSKYKSSNTLVFCGLDLSQTLNSNFLDQTLGFIARHYLDAEQDIKAAIHYVTNKYHKNLILWGSSYSSTLALYLAVESDQEKAVLAFSPGNYFAEEKGSLIDKLAIFKKPMFITSSKREAPEITQLLSKMTLNDNQVHFIPRGNGHHGSRVLWEQQIDGVEYWNAVNSF